MTGEGGQGELFRGGFSGAEADYALLGSPPAEMRLALRGSLGNEAGIALLRDYERALGRYSSIKIFVLDLSRVLYASSTAVGAFASMFMLASARGITLRILDPGDQISMVLRILGFDSFLPIVRSGGEG